MEIIKEILDNLESCYACTNIVIDGRNYYLAASEAKNSCHIIDEITGKVTAVWNEVGGTMSLVPLPFRNGEFLASQKFYPGFNAQESTIVWAFRNNGSWEVKTLFSLPYIHRFDVLTSDNKKQYFIGCTLCDKKTSIDDWSSGGRIMVGEMLENMEQPFELQSILSGLIKNHGYYRIKYNGMDASIITYDEGAYRVIPQNNSNDKWQTEKILDFPISDLAFIDIDWDGKDELVTIEAFHGNSFQIYKEEKGNYRKVYSLPGQLEFGHVVWAGSLGGIPTIIGGYRKNKKELFYIRYINGNYKTVTIDEGIGPCNIFVVHHENKDVVVSTNGAKNEIARYTFKYEEETI